MSSFKLTINLESEFTTQELAEFFAALSQVERGNSQPLIRILHPAAPPPSTEVAVDAPTASAPIPVEPTLPVPAPAPAPAPTRNIQWERSNITLVAENQVDDLYRQILAGELVSPSPSIHWAGSKHSPRAQHNQRILNSLRQAANRTLSYQMIAAQAGIPEADKLKSFLRELEKQGFLTVVRIR